MTGDPKVLAVARDGFEGEIRAETPPGNPDVRLVVVSAVRVVFIRVARTYIQALIGLLTAFGLSAVGLLPTAEPIDQLALWQKVLTAAGLALFPAFWSFLQNTGELLAKVDVKGPEWRG
jgi:hypothetical protein